MMKRMLLVLAVILMTAGMAQAATVSWILPSSYTSGDPIPQAKISQIVVKVYTGPSATQCDTADATSTAGATSVQASNPAPGGTLWYCITASLDGQESIKSASKSLQLPFQTPDAPSGLTVTFP